MKEFSSWVNYFFEGCPPVCDPFKKTWNTFFDCVSQFRTTDWHDKAKLCFWVLHMFYAFPNMFSQYKNTKGDHNCFLTELNRMKVIEYVWNNFFLNTGSNDLNKRQISGAFNLVKLQVWENYLFSFCFNFPTCLNVAASNVFPLKLDVVWDPFVQTLPEKSQ